MIRHCAFVLSSFHYIWCHVFHLHIPWHLLAYHPLFTLFDWSASRLSCRTPFVYCVVPCGSPIWFIHSDRSSGVMDPLKIFNLREYDHILRGGTISWQEADEVKRGTITALSDEGFLTIVLSSKAFICMHVCNPAILEVIWACSIASEILLYVLHVQITIPPCRSPLSPLLNPCFTYFWH